MPKVSEALDFLRRVEADDLAMEALLSLDLLWGLRAWFR